MDVLMTRGVLFAWNWKVKSAHVSGTKAFTHRIRCSREPSAPTCMLFNATFCSYPLYLILGAMGLTAVVVHYRNFQTLLTPSPHFLLKKKKKKPVSFIRHSVITKIQQPDVNSRGDEDKIIFSLHIVLDFVETVDVIASNRLTLHSLTLHGSGLYMLRISLKESDTLCGY